MCNILMGAGESWQAYKRCRKKPGELTASFQGWTALCGQAVPETPCRTWKRSAGSLISEKKATRKRPNQRPGRPRSEEHTSELQSLMRISYAVFCLKKKKK